MITLTHFKEMVVQKKKKLKLGLALGAGGAKGFIHIGVLKVLHKHNIPISYLAGTSMGAVIAAAYAAGKTPEELEDLLKHTNWQEMIDFTIPKTGLLKGKRISRKLDELVLHKRFKQTVIPLSIIAYDLSDKKKVIFNRGDIAQAVRASVSIPGIFNPMMIKKKKYVDGAVADPNPFEDVKEMGADVVLLVDTSNPKSEVLKTAAPPPARFLPSLKDQFVREEIAFLGTVLFPEHWPKTIRKTLRWLFKTIFYPARVLRLLAGKEPYPIGKIMYETFHLLNDNLAREQLINAQDCLIISPKIDNLQWSDFDKAEQFIKIGEKATEKIIPELKKRLAGNNKVYKSIKDSFTKR